MQVVIRVKIRCMREENKGLRRQIEGTKAEEVNEKLRRETKGADSAKGGNKMREGEINM